jgi:uncharacterized protein (DUF1778 family)
MGLRSSQLQIRISPEQKATLKRLAAAEGRSVSAFVLSKALPPGNTALEQILERIASGDRAGLTELWLVLEALPPNELRQAVESVRVADLPASAGNQVAGLVEELASVSGLEPPGWTSSVPPLERPLFRWPLTSLRALQLARSPVALKKRNVFEPGGHGLPRTQRAPEPDGPRTRAFLESPQLQRLRRIGRELELDVEFYVLGGPVLHHAFAAKPRSARPRDLFVDSSRLERALEAAGREQAWQPSWAEDAVREALATAPGAPFLDLPHLRAFTPPAGYALAVKLAGARAVPDPRDLDELRHLLRSEELRAVEGALEVVRRYLPERHLPPGTRGLLERLLGG